mgnify:CR=1 FL=1
MEWEPSADDVAGTVEEETFSAGMRNNAMDFHAHDVNDDRVCCDGDRTLHAQPPGHPHAHPAGWPAPLVNPFQAREPRPPSLITSAGPGARPSPGRECPPAPTVSTRVALCRHT